MKIYNALSKSFTDEVKTQIGGGKSIDEAFEDVKSAIIDNNFGEPTVTPESTPTPSPGSTLPQESTPTSTPTPTKSPLTEGSGQKIGKDGKVYHYVDLDLPRGTMWATCNLGAESALGDGLLFQFGRVDGYAYLDSRNQFKTNKQNFVDTGNSYIPLVSSLEKLEESGNPYDKGTILQPDDDAANVNMGDPWRMPTNSDIDELYTYTTHQCTIVNNVNGVLFTSPANNNKLFIPFSQDSWNDGSWNHYEETSAYLWSSQVDADHADSAYILSCGTNGVAYINASATRNKTFPIRAVF